jgi:hypothetical protein
LTKELKAMVKMVQLRIFVMFVFQMIHFSSPINECIPLEDCIEAVKYVRKRRHDPNTLEILRNAHCGSAREAKIICDRIPPFKVGCVHFRECPEAYELIKTRKHDAEVKQLLRSATCGDSDRKDMVMCEIVANSSKVISKRELLPKQYDCGAQVLGNKISNGEIAELNDFPWLALLKYKIKNGTSKLNCHGTLISRKYVVTAAHCVDFTLARKVTIGVLDKVVLGEYDLDNTTDCILREYGGPCADPIQELSIESNHSHPKFGTVGGGLYDIALIRLKDPATFSVYVKPICLPLNRIDVALGETFWISGWGRTKPGGPISKIKLKGRVHHLTRDQCNTDTLQPDVTQICAGSNNGTDTCSGDSGGPLMFQKVFDDHEVRNILVGVVSFGVSCGAGRGIYTDVSSYMDWILETIQK